MRGVSQANMDLGIFRETKITNGVYTHGSDGYNIIATDTPSQQNGRVAVFYCLSPRFGVKAIQKFGLPAGERGAAMLPDA